MGWDWFRRSRRRPSGGAVPAVPPGHRIYAVGDIHGRADLLAALQEQIVADAADVEPGVEKTVLYLGDYIDRGLDSRAVIERLAEAPLPGFTSVHLKGNHEDAVLRFLEDASIGPSWFAIGGDATALSYGAGVAPGLPVAERFARVRAALRERLPSAHLEFLRRLELAFQAGDYVFVHAAPRPGTALERQDPEDLMWLREGGEQWGEEFGRVVVHGHSTSYEPVVHRHRIGIDTGAYATNVLTCLALEGTRRWFLSTQSSSKASL